jgi:hypothetical protein
VVASLSSSTKGSISLIEASGVASITLGFFAIVFLATVLMSFLPEGLAPVVETTRSISSTLGVFLLVKVQAPCSKEGSS